MLEASLVFCFGGRVGLLRATLCPFCNHLTTFGLGCQNSRAGLLILIISKLLTVSFARLLPKSVCCRFITLKPCLQLLLTPDKCSAACVTKLNFHFIMPFFLYSEYSNKMSTMSFALNPRSLHNDETSLLPYSVLSTLSSGQYDLS